MTVEIELPADAAKALSALPPPPNVTIDSVETQAVNSIPVSDFIPIVTVIISFPAFVSVAQIVIWIYKAVKDKQAKDITINRTKIILQKGDFRMEIENEFRKVIENKPDNPPK